MYSPIKASIGKGAHLLPHFTMLLEIVGLLIHGNFYFDLPQKIKYKNYSVAVLFRFSYFPNILPRSVRKQY